MNFKLPDIQWDVLWSTLRTLLVGGGPVTTLLIALDFPPVQVGKWTAISLAVIGVLSILLPGLKGALNRTDSSKIADAKALPDKAKTIIAEQLPVEIKIAAVKSLPDEAKAVIAEQLPNEIKIPAVAAIPDVALVVVKSTATNGAAMVAADPEHPKVVTNSVI